MKTQLLVGIIIAGACLWGCGQSESSNPSVRAREHFEESQRATIDRVRFFSSAETNTIRCYGGSIIYLSANWETIPVDRQEEALIHEYLHCVATFRETLILAPDGEPAPRTWLDDFYSEAEPYARTVLQNQLFQNPGYKQADYPRETFAFIGTMIALGQGAVPENIRAYYEGVLR